MKTKVVKCVFCEKEEALILKKSRYLTWVANKFQSATGLSLMLIPNRHCETFADLTKEEKKVFVEEIGCFVKKHPKTKVRLNQGEKAGQTIPHLHLLCFLNGADDGGLLATVESKKFVRGLSLVGEQVFIDISSEMEIYKCSSSIEKIFEIFSLCLSNTRAGNVMLYYDEGTYIAYVIKRKGNISPYRRLSTVEVIHSQITEMKELFS